MQKKHSTTASQTRHSLFEFSNFPKQNRNATSLEECKRTWHRNHESQTRHSVVGSSNFQKQNDNAKKSWYRNHASQTRHSLVGFSYFRKQNHSAKSLEGCQKPWHYHAQQSLRGGYNNHVRMEIQMDFCDYRVFNTSISERLNDLLAKCFSSHRCFHHHHRHHRHLQANRKYISARC